MKKTYTGSCHCGNIRFECDIDLSQATSKCNCSICMKGRFWKTIARAHEFRLLQGKELLSDYTFGSHSIHHLFCKRCGVKPFGRGYMEELGGEFYAVNIACLDNATDEELANAPVHYENGRNNDWGAPPPETGYL